MDSGKLKIVQDFLETKLIQSIAKPQSDYSSIKALVEILEEVDTSRREVWREETFGMYEKAVGEVLDTGSSFCSDDIPF